MPTPPSLFSHLLSPPERVPSPVTLVSFLSHCTHRAPRAAPSPSALPMPVGLMLALVLLLVPLFDSSLFAHLLRRAPSSPARERHKLQHRARAALFALAAVVSLVQIVAHGLALAANVATLRANDAAQHGLVACLLASMHVSDVASIDRFLIALEAARAAAFALVALLFVVLLYRLYFNQRPAAAAAAAANGGARDALEEDPEEATTTVPETAPAVGDYSAPAVAASDAHYDADHVPHLLPPRVAKLAALFFVALAVSATLLLVPVRISTHGCAFDRAAGRYVCHARDWENILSVELPFAAADACDASTATVLGGEPSVSAPTPAPRGARAAVPVPATCGRRPSRRALRAFGESLLRVSLSLHVVLPKLLLAVALSLGAAVAVAIAAYLVLREKRAGGRRPAFPLGASLRAAAVALVAAQIAACAAVGIAVARMLRDARGAVVCGCAGDTASLAPGWADVRAGAVAVVDALKLVVVLAKLPRKLLGQHDGEGAADEGSAEERVALLGDARDGRD